MACIPQITKAVVPALLKQIAPLISEGIADQIEFQLKPVKEQMAESDTKVAALGTQAQVTQDLIKDLNEKFDKMQCQDTPRAPPCESLVCPLVLPGLRGRLPSMAPPPLQPLRQPEFLLCLINHPRDFSASPTLQFSLSLFTI